MGYYNETFGLTFRVIYSLLIKATLYNISLMSMLKFSISIRNSQETAKMHLKKTAYQEFERQFSGIQMYFANFKSEPK